MSVLVTGASGHLGNNLVRALLARGRSVRALVRAESVSLHGLTVDRRTGDVLDRSSLEAAFTGVETVFHFAAVVSLAPQDGPRVLETNVLGTRNVVAACLARGVRRLVHCSSIHALAPGGENDVTDESLAGNAGPHANAYDKSKTGGELEIHAGIARGLDAVIINPTAVIGPHDYVPRLSGRAFIDMYSGKMKFGVAAGFNWVDVRDVAAGAIAAEQRGRTGQRYLLSGHWASFRRIVELMHDATGHAGPSFFAPLWVAKLGVPFIAAYAKLSGEHPLYTATELRVLTEHRDCRNQKAMSELGFAPRPLERTIADAFAFYGHAGLLHRAATLGTSLPAGAFVDAPA